MFFFVARACFPIVPGVLYVGGKRWDGSDPSCGTMSLSVKSIGCLYVRPSSFQNLKVNVIFNTRKWMMSRDARRGGGTVDEDFFVEGLFLSVGNLFLFKLWASFLKWGGLHIIFLFIYL